jgi:hypothetical protein
MNREPDGHLTWDLADIAQALKISADDVLEYFTDGRRVSFILERRIAREVLRGTLAKSEGAGFDLMDAQGRKWEVRSVSQGGVYFCPSYMVGSGRSFELSGFLAKLDDIEGYILADIEAFPRVPFWTVPSKEVRAWWNAGELGRTTKVSRKRELELVRRPAR